MKIALIVLSFSLSTTAMALENISFQLACAASVCGKNEGSICKEVLGQKLQPIVVQLKDPGGWPRRLFGNTTCSMSTNGVTLDYRVDVVVGPDKNVINLIPSLKSDIKSSIQQTNPGEIYLRDISKLTYNTFRGQSVESGEVFVVPVLAVDSLTGTF